MPGPRAQYVSRGTPTAVNSAGSGCSVQVDRTCAQGREGRGLRRWEMGSTPPKIACKPRPAPPFSRPRPAPPPWRFTKRSQIGYPP